MSIHECLYEITDPDETTELNQVFPFQVGSLRYTLNGLSTINRLIRIGTRRRNYGIGAWSDTMQGDLFARYTQPTGFDPTTGLPRRPEIVAGFNSFGGNVRTAESRRGLLLHECIHAMQDNLGSLTMRVDTAEAAAYIAQCLFHRARARGVGLDSDEAAAWDATEQIRNPGSDRTATNIDSLLSAIRNDPLYRNEYRVTGRYNGIPRPEQPRPEQPRSQPSRGCTCSASGFSNRSGLTRLSRILGM